jgi:LPPG:FO 2-phospho-L-lactate transferase
MAAITKDLTVICNVGDNIWLLGLYICPDIDTITYGLAGLLDEKRGWGIRNDSFECLASLRKLGAPSWFRLGDRDLATHLARTLMIRNGRSLSMATERIRDHYSISAKIIPASDDEVSTIIKTEKGEMHLQEFWVKFRGAPKVKGVRFKGSESAKANLSAIKAIRRSNLIVIAPANPVSSIGPIVSVKSLKNELRKKRNRVAAVTPMIGRKALSGPAAKYMKSLGLKISSVGLAEYYRDFVGNFVISKADAYMVPKIQNLGMYVYQTDVRMKNRQGEVRLARDLLEKFKIR